jgi:hypothetical protein
MTVMILTALMMVLVVAAVVVVVTIQVLPRAQAPLRQLHRRGGVPVEKPA